MAIFPTLTNSALCAILLTIIIVIYIHTSRKITRRWNRIRYDGGGKKLPEPSGSWPLLGHLSLLGSDALLHRVFGAMADCYGPAFSIQLGARQTLVISSWELVKECFTTNDRAFATRPRSLAVKLMGYDHAMLGFAPYGTYWRDMRKLAVVELLSNHRLEQLRPVWETEINLFLRDLYKLWVKNGHCPVQVEMKERIGDLTMNIGVWTIAGKRYRSTGGSDEELRRGQKALADFFQLVGQFMYSDAIPSLGWLDVINGSTSKMKKTAKELDWVLGNWVNEHRHRRKRDTAKIDEAGRDFMDVLLSSLDETKLPAHEIDTIIKANCLSLISGANDTTVVTLTWAISLLLNNREALKKVQDELELHVGWNRQVDESDIPNLVYLNAVVKETLRLYPAGPLSVPREAMEDCTIGGFHVPAGTCLLVNMWKMHRDPRIWSDPSEFRPERFMTTHESLDVKGRDFEYIPFGSGRRMCPGVSFALQVLHLALARLLHGFELGTLLDLKVDMTESPGLTMPKATPLEVVLTPRLPSTCY
ncbi:xanthotoxin 5-hydroxylase CYP82C4-like [Punica granatum]|uniref:Xanthotoxin 5-hydroxylase CYP82C4-like n=1 Tax=Punica granatum TaxID=22663 RepID=A0A6P8CXL0_PUNGR|nr:xanthotoxin 5-hydroxylase CYP82C4-like [Punica granatum]